MSCSEAEYHEGVSEVVGVERVSVTKQIPSMPKQTARNKNGQGKLQLEKMTERQERAGICDDEKRGS